MLFDSCFEFTSHVIKNNIFVWWHFFFKAKNVTLVNDYDTHLCQKLNGKTKYLPFRLPKGPQNEFPLPIILSSMYLISLAASSALWGLETHHLAGRSSCMDSDFPFVPLDFFNTLVILLAHYTICVYFLHTLVTKTHKL